MNVALNASYIQSSYISTQYSYIDVFTRITTFKN